MHPAPVLLALALATAPAPSPLALAAAQQPAAADPGSSLPLPISPDELAPLEEPPEARPQTHYAAVPLLSYGSSIGVQFGGALYVYRTRPEDPERRDWIVFGGAWATQGPRIVEVKGERLGLGGDAGLRVFGQVKYQDDDRAPYWGQGADLGGLAVEPGAGAPPPPARYHMRGPWLLGVLRGALSGPVGWFTRLRWRYDAIVERGQLLEQEQPEGVDGGGLLLLGAGVLYDTRDREIATTRGVFTDVSVFAAPELPGISRYPLAGFDAAVRGYLPLTRNVVLAGRALYDLKHGTVPMFERTQYEGLVYGEGLGGPNTVRGLARARLAGEKKLLVGAELRATLVTAHLFDKLQELGLGAGVDVGRARDSGEAPLSAVGGYGQARIIWDRAILMRIEAGYAGQGKLGWYVSFGESF